MRNSLYAAIKTITVDFHAKDRRKTTDNYRLRAVIHQRLLSANPRHGQ